jgi:hypothetical protein
MDITERVHRALHDGNAEVGGPDVLAEEVFGTAMKIPSKIALAHEGGAQLALEEMYEVRGLVARLESGLLMARQIGRMDLVSDLLFECKLLSDAVNEEIESLGGATKPDWHDDLDQT